MAARTNVDLRPQPVTLSLRLWEALSDEYLNCPHLRDLSIGNNKQFVGFYLPELSETDKKDPSKVHKNRFRRVFKIMVKHPIQLKIVDVSLIEHLG